MEQLNISFFNAVNANANLQGHALWLAIFAAKYLIYVALLGLIGLWIWGASKRRKTLIIAFVACALGLFINWLIGQIWFHPRPFVLGIGHTFIHHAPDSSFPSDHTTGLCTMCFIFLWRESMRSVVGLLLLFVTLCMGWARIYTGVHFPFDILGSVIVSFIAATITVYLTPLLEKYLIPIPEYIHHKLFHSPREMTS